MNKKDSLQDIDLLAEVASLYYKEGLSHQEIADKLFYSRTKVTRMLIKAKEIGLVEININIPLIRVKVLEEEIKRQYNLDDVVILRDYNIDEMTMLKKLCGLAAEYLEGQIKDGMTIGVSWGLTIDTLAEALRPLSRRDVKIVQLVGAVARQEDSKFDSSEIIRSLASKWDAEWIPLHAPMRVRDESTAQILRDEHLIHDAMKVGSQADLIITGISSFTQHHQSRWERHLSPSERLELLNKGAVGILLARFIDQRGQVIPSSINDRVIGIDMALVKQNPNVVCIAAGAAKSQSLKAALNGKLIKRLIIDEQLAKTLR